MVRASLQSLSPRHAGCAIFKDCSKHGLWTIFIIAPLFHLQVCTTPVKSDWQIVSALVTPMLVASL